MKRILSLSAAIIAACALAQASVDIRPVTSTVPTRHHATARRLSSQEAAKQIAAFRGTKKYEAEPKVMEHVPSIMEIEERGSVTEKSVKTPINAFYNLGEGIFYPGLQYQTIDGNTGWYYSGYFMNGQAYNFSVIGTKGDSWALTNSAATDLNEYAEDGVLKLDNGIGGWYGPQITNTKARETYYYGGTWASGVYTNYPNGFENSGMYLGTYDEEQYYMPLAIYDPLECTDYVGHGVGQYGFGSTTYYGASGSTLVELGNVGGGLVVDHLQFKMLSASGTPMGEGAEITVTIYDYEGEDFDNAKVYTAELSPSDFIEDGVGSYGTYYCVNVYFSDLDEEGFETEIAPVLNNNVEIVINDNQTNVDYGFFMNSDDREDPDQLYSDGSGYPVVEARTFWWYGEEQGYYRWRGSNATIDIMGYFNNLSTYGSSERSAVGYVPNDATYYEDSETGTKYAYAVSSVSVTGDTVYNDFDVASTFDIESIEVDYDEDVVAVCEFDSSYFSSNNAILFYVGLKELPSDVETRTTTVTITSNNEVSYPITITQYGATAGINAITKDVEKEDNEIYNLQGVKVGQSDAVLAPGVYVKNGKKFVK